MLLLLVLIPCLAHELLTGSPPITPGSAVSVEVADLLLRGHDGDALRQAGAQVDDAVGLELHRRAPRDDLALVDVDGARDQLAQSADTLKASLEHLSGMLSRATFGDLLDAVGSAWKPLAALLAARAARAARRGRRGGRAAAGGGRPADLGARGGQSGVDGDDHQPVRAPGHAVPACRQAGAARDLARRRQASASRADAQDIMVQFEQALHRLGELPLSTAAIRIELVGAVRRR
jgi:hypothetical protein